MIKIPYIKDENNRREELRNGAVAQNAGELNFKIFSYVKKCGVDAVCYAQIEDYIKEFLGDKPNYQKYNDMTGAVDRCCVEILRRFTTKENATAIGILIDNIIEILASYDDEIADYEDIKISENGDV